MGKCRDLEEITRLLGPLSSRVVSFSSLKVAISFPLGTYDMPRILPLWFYWTFTRSFQMHSVRLSFILPERKLRLIESGGKQQGQRLQSWASLTPELVCITTVLSESKENSAKTLPSQRHTALVMGGWMEKLTSPLSTGSEFGPNLEHMQSLVISNDISCPGSWVTCWRFLHPGPGLPPFRSFLQCVPSRKPAGSSKAEWGSVGLLLVHVVGERKFSWTKQYWKVESGSANSTRHTVQSFGNYEIEVATMPL